MSTRVVDFNEYKARKAAEQRDRVLAPISPRTSYGFGTNRWVLDPDSSDCGCVNGQARWFQS
jgi:hypothetical protein